MTCDHHNIAMRRKYAPKALEIFEQIAKRREALPNVREKNDEVLGGIARSRCEKMDALDDEMQVDP